MAAPSPSAAVGGSVRFVSESRRFPYEANTRQRQRVLLF